MAPYLDMADLATWIHVTVTSSLDYCNALYFVLPPNSAQKFQLVQNINGRGNFKNAYWTQFADVPLAAHLLPSSMLLYGIHYHIRNFSGSWWVMRQPQLLQALAHQQPVGCQRKSHSILLFQAYFQF